MRWWGTRHFYGGHSGCLYFNLGGDLDLDLDWIGLDLICLVTSWDTYHLVRR